jgi:hypothetical protein
MMIPRSRQKREDETRKCRGCKSLREGGRNVGRQRALGSAAPLRYTLGMAIYETVTIRWAKCKESECRSKVKFDERIPDGETRLAECREGHRFEYGPDDVISRSSDIKIGKYA